ncbi:GNAT family N-acetyltransferase [Mycobacterium riyadhense]|uniref:GNAT family N-acetyltransferase n=1 Tax=Mycobacterium riyadhense TaxID=486698 RepID=UPI000A159895|nr:GNAT family protein [Mycobacterium riyadhense]MCV7145914.1 GNAT family N-acetyltransferase [Mycobacterium riyadhense]
MKPPVLATDRLVLHCVTSADEDAIVQACNDPLIVDYLPFPVPYTHEDARKFIADSAVGWAEDTTYGFGFYDTATDQLAGTCALMKTHLRGVVELGYWTAPDCRNGGFTIEAARRLCQWGFDQLAIHRIEGWVIVGNERSNAVALKIGFEREGMLRQRAYRKGQPRDWWVYGLLSRPS